MIYDFIDEGSGWRFSKTIILILEEYALSEATVPGGFDCGRM